MLTAMLSLLLSACSLLTIRTPDKPLTVPEQQARTLSRDFAAHFSTGMIQAIDDAAPPESDAAVRAVALRLKIGIVTGSARAATGLSPTGDLLDIWAFSRQLRDFLTSGAGAELFGASQDHVRQAVDQFEGEAEALARKITGPDFPRYQKFVAGYAFRYPLEGPDCARTSLLATWMTEEGGDAPVRAEGTAAQAVGDLSDRMRIYSEEVPEVGLWQAELMLDRAGVDSAGYRAALRSLDARLERISLLADTSPALVHEAIGQLRSSLNQSSDRLDTAWLQMLHALHVEREAFAANIASERASLVDAADLQRARVAADAAQIAERAVETSWAELRKLVRDALLLLIVLSALLLGLPFAAGYLLGRHRK